jgi:hypothetical protein
VDIAKPGTSTGPDLATLQGQKGESVAAERGEGQLQKSGAGGTAVRPMLEISAEARERIERQEALQMAREQYDQAPETRAEAVEQARQRLDSGFYDSDEVAEVLTEKLSTLIRRLDAVSR